MSTTSRDLSVIDVYQHQLKFISPVDLSFIEVYQWLFAFQFITMVVNNIPYQVNIKRYISYISDCLPVYFLLGLLLKCLTNRKKKKKAYCWYLTFVSIHDCLHAHLLLDLSLIRHIFFFFLLFFFFKSSSIHHYR